MALQNISQSRLARFITMDEMIRFISRLPWDVINNAISASLEPGKVLMLPVPTVQDIYAWFNPKTYYSDLNNGVRCYVIQGDNAGLFPPHKSVRIEALKRADFEFRDMKSDNDWITKTPAIDSSVVEFVDYVRARYGMQEVLIKRFKNTTLELIQREARVIGIASSLGISPHFIGMLDESEETWGNPAIVIKHYHNAIPLDTYIQCKPLLSRYQVFELCKRIAGVFRSLHNDQILLNDVAICHLAALGDPNPSVHPLDPHIVICDLSEATFKDGTRYDIPRSARHLYSHAAPEVLAGKHTSQGSDVYCLGKILSMVMNAFDAVKELYLLVAWCCNNRAEARPDVDTVCIYLMMLQDLQKQKCNQALESMDVVKVDFKLKKGIDGTENMI